MRSPLNLPNSITSLRLLLAVVMFVFLAYEQYGVSLVLFLLAAGTDWLDGFIARRYGLITTLGRILDPFADKVIVCGVLVFLVAIPAINTAAWGLRPWMVVLVIGRELLVTALRSFLEQRGADFSATMSGKLKMVLQCAAAGACLLYLCLMGVTQPAPEWAWWLMVVSVWSAVVLTAWSGVIYILAAMRLMRARW